RIGGEWMGTYNGLYRLGSLVGMAAGGVLGPWIGLRDTLLLFGCLSLIGIPFLLLSFPSEKRGEMAAKKGDFASPPRKRTRLSPFVQRFLGVPGFSGDSPVYVERLHSPVR